MNKKPTILENASTLLLRGALIAMGAVILFLCVIMFSAFTNPQNSEFKLIVTGLYVAAVPFFYALYQAWLLLDYIKTNNAFSEHSVKALGAVRSCAAIIAGLFLLYSPMYYSLSQREDAPGVLGICLIIVFMSVVIALFTGVLQKLFQNAVDIKSENDLTV